MVGLAGWITLSPLIPPCGRAGEVNDLVEQLRHPKNRVIHVGAIVPGGEVLEFSPPMKGLIKLGKKALPSYILLPFPPPYPSEYPGPGFVRQCNSWLAQEARPSGVVIVPHSRCWWQRG